MRAALYIDGVFPFPLDFAVDYFDRFVPLPGLVARTEIFRSAEDSLSILATDALAERVMRAGCDGVVFREPETIGILGRDDEPRLIRTAYGIARRRFRFLGHLHRRTDRRPISLPPDTPVARAPAALRTFQ